MLQVHFFKYSGGSEYNKAYKAGMAIARFRVLNNELLDKDTDGVP